MQDQIAGAVGSVIRPPPNLLVAQLLEAFHNVRKVLLREQLLRVGKKQPGDRTRFCFHGLNPRPDPNPDGYVLGIARTVADRVSCHSERSEESLFGVSPTHRKILRFAQNDKIREFFACLEAATRCQSRRNVTSMGTTTGTALPPGPMAGLKRHCLTASTAFSSRPSPGPLTT